MHDNPSDTARNNSYRIMNHREWVDKAYVISKKGALGFLPPPLTPKMDSPRIDCQLTLINFTEHKLDLNNTLRD